MIDAMVFAPHPDDAELGMGATIALMLEQGMQVVVVDMSDGEPTPHGSPEARAKETAAASEALGLTDRVQLDFPNRAFVHDLAGRYKLAGLIRRYRPRWLFAPYLPDAHPDHVVATRLIEDARFDAKLTKVDLPGEPHSPERIIYYFCTHLRVHAPISFCVDVTATHAKKMRALEAYQSQFYVNRGEQAGAVPEMIRARDRYFGTRIGTTYAEPFFLYEPVGLRSLEQVV